jgi:hypothetical protein
MAKRQKDRQHNGQKTEGQITQWTKDGINVIRYSICKRKKLEENTIYKGKSRYLQYRETLMEQELISLQVHMSSTTQWPKDRRTDNTMAKRQKDRQHNGQKTEGQTTQWPKDRTDNTMAKRKRTKGQIFN